MNKIVEKVEASPLQKISQQNEALIQLNRLKFLYYEVKIGRALYQHENPTFPRPHVTGIHCYPGKKEKEVRYFYRGEGRQKDMIIEIAVYPDRTANLRYHRYMGFRDSTVCQT